MEKKLNQVRYALAALCFLYCIFVCGFSYGFFLIQKMVEYESSVTSKDYFRGSGEIILYSNQLKDFCLIGASFFVFLLLTKYSKKMLSEILGLFLLILAIYQFLAYPKPAYLPGQTVADSFELLNSVMWSFVVFAVITILLIILQIITIYWLGKTKGRSEAD